MPRDLDRLGGQRQLHGLEQHLMLSGSDLRFDDLYREISLPAGDQPAYAVRSRTSRARGDDSSCRAGSLTLTSFDLLLDRGFATSPERARFARVRSRCEMLFAVHFTFITDG
jgi:hypothetical protein